LQGSSKFEEVDLTRCFVSRLKSSFWKLQMLGSSCGGAMV
jgi:hypothetical protein